MLFVDLNVFDMVYDLFMDCRHYKTQEIYVKTLISNIVPICKDKDKDKDK